VIGERVGAGKGVANPVLVVVLSALGSVEAIETMEILQDARHVIDDAMPGQRRTIHGRPRLRRATRPAVTCCR